LIKNSARILGFAILIFSPVPIVIGSGSLIAQQMRIDKPDKPNEPRGDGCVPVGVSKSPNDIVYGIEDCHGRKYKTRLN
jgi:hypothetical protein